MASHWHAKYWNESPQNCRSVWGVSVIFRLLKRHREARTVKERDHSGKPHKTSPRDNRALSQSARRRPFSTARRLRDNWAIHGRVSVRTVSRRLNCTHLKA